ncbi:ADP-ribosylglycohydrolase family protein [Phyllobacterium zundukense]|uniref:ADP-ribosylglycohydrolase family protein n=1 Tax=Phyllobacterium zundukense TaxID=1867719 RepID=A0ACD4CW69_9HYPH|nr:ADP-ribosylglycohydrolase family protein [Phyllobacterium zundukense]UXN57708.1 ADP-ribosylglycohydrolase family protein [Phyllobacterium zundukense]
MTNDTNLSLKGRVRALLFGVAYGDAIGAPVEKLSAVEIRDRYGKVTSLDTAWHRMNQSEIARSGRVRGSGIVTDDTLMTLCLMSVYNDVRRHLDAWDMADGMVREIAWKPRWVPELQREALLIERLFYPEKWIFQRHQLTNCDPREGGIGNMVNCGAAMYIAPIGVVNACDPKAAYDEAIAFASGHQQSFGLEAAGVLAAAIAAALVPGTTVDKIIDEALLLAKDGTKKAIAGIVDAAQGLKGAEHAKVVETFHSIIGKYSPMGDDVVHSIKKAGVPSEAYRPSRINAIEELPLALGFAVVNDGDFYRTIQDGINSGRDTDSIGVMAGAILGAMHGEAVIDAAVAAQLDRVNRLTLFASADAFTETAIAVQSNDHRREAARLKARQALQSSPEFVEIQPL